jgi:uncharacterized SAM-binding protein YcdF (DUF218 family)
MMRKKFWAVLLAFILCIFLLFQYRFPIAKGLGNFLAKGDPLEKCDVIFVPWSHLSTNFFYAVHLLKGGWGDRLVMTYPKPSLLETQFGETYGLDHCAGSSIVRHVFQQEMLPVEKLTILEGSISTFTDCELLHAHWKKSPFRSVMVVTDAPHARRFRMVMDKVFGDANVKILSRPCFPERPLEDFFADEEDYVMYVSSEYVKIVAYMLKYGI